MEHDEMCVYQKISLFPRDFGHMFGEREVCSRPRNKARSLQKSGCSSKRKP